MRNKAIMSVALALVALAGLLALWPAAAAEEVGKRAEGQHDLDQVNASPTEEKGVYHVTPEYVELVKVTVIKRGGPYGLDHTRTLDGWSYDNKAGRLTVKETIDNEREMVLVHGERKVPWAWRMEGAISDVKVLVGNEAAVRGQDYEVDETAGTVRFLKNEHCKKGVHYYISYAYRDQPSKGGAIGNHPDRAVVRKFLGLHPVPDEKADVGKTIGTNASPTDNPNIWTMTQSLRSDSIRIGLGRRSVKGKFDWLERGKGFAYDETLAAIVLLHELPLEDDSWMFVTGVPSDRGRFLLHSKLVKGEVKVILGDRLLEEGVGFKVDYDQGIVTIIDKAIEEKGAKYYISAGGRALGNISDMALIHKLLQK